MSALKKIPAILVLPYEGADLALILRTFNETGVRPCYVIHAFPLETDDPAFSALQFLRCNKREIPRCEAEVLRVMTQKDPEFEQLMLFEDESAVTSADVLACVYASADEPADFYSIETNAVLHNESSAHLFLMKRIVGSYLDEPTPFFWVIPRRACEILAADKKIPRFFPLSWLHQCHEAEIPIQNLSLDSQENFKFSQSHFGFLRILLYSLNLFLGFAASGLISTVVDNLVFFILTLLNLSNLPALIASRVVSTLVNYSLLRLAVFREKGKSGGSFLRYICLVIFSTSIVWLALNVLSRNFPHNPVWIKMAIEMVMFFFNYLASKLFVFRSAKTSVDTES